MPSSGQDSNFINRSLEENRFWLRIMKEHSLFLSEGFNRRDSALIAQANRFFAEFDALLRESMVLPSQPDVILQFNERVIRRVADLRNFKQEVLLKIILGRIQGFNLPLLVDHIRREAEYFITTLTRLNKGIDEPIEASIVRENIFWLRIMADHSRFIKHLLDPSERRLVQTADQFADGFDQLLSQARDLESMVKGVSPVLIVVGGHLLDEVTLVRLQQADERKRERDGRETLIEPPPPVLARFNQESRQAAQEIRDFKRQAHVLISGSRALSIINPLLADHVAREAEKFLNVLAGLEARINQTFRPVQALVIDAPAPPCDNLRSN